MFILKSCLIRIFSIPFRNLENVSDIAGWVTFNYQNTQTFFIILFMWFLSFFFAIFLHFQEIFFPQFGISKLVNTSSTSDEIQLNLTYSPPVLYEKFSFFVFNIICLCYVMNAK